MIGTSGCYFAKLVHHSINEKQISKRKEKVLLVHNKVKNGELSLAACTPLNS